MCGLSNGEFDWECGRSGSADGVVHPLAKVHRESYASLINRFVSWSSTGTGFDNYWFIEQIYEKFIENRCMLD